MRIVCVLLAFGLAGIVYGRPTKREGGSIDPSEQTLIRVARNAELEEEEEPEVKQPKVDSIKKRAAEEEAFFETLLTRAASDDTANKKSVHAAKRSYIPGGGDQKGFIIREDWAGDSKISDADKAELESLFAAINGENTDDSKLDEKRAANPLDQKVKEFSQWLLGKSNIEFSASLRHFLNVQTKLTDAFRADVLQGDDASCYRTCSNCTLSNYLCQCQYQCKAGFLPNTQSQLQPCLPPSCTPEVKQPIAMPQLASHQAKSGPNAAARTMITAPQPPAQMPVAAPQAMPMPMFQQMPQPMMQPMMPAPAMQPAYTGYPQTYPGYSYGQPMPSAFPPQQAQPAQPVAPPKPEKEEKKKEEDSDKKSEQTQNDEKKPKKSKKKNKDEEDEPEIEVDNLHHNKIRDCSDYSKKECQRYLDETTDIGNTLDASLRFKQRWNDDLGKVNSHKFLMFIAEVQKAISNVFHGDTNYIRTDVTQLKDEDEKVCAYFTIYFRGPATAPLRKIYTAIAKNYLAGMPVYRYTLLRKGMKHHHRPRVVTAAELEKAKAENVQKTEQANFMSNLQNPNGYPYNSGVVQPYNRAIMAAPGLQSNTGYRRYDINSPAYQGCFKDKKPNRDLAASFSKFEMTPEWCIDECRTHGYKFAGLQYAYLCFCGNKFGKYGKAPNSECSLRCYGDNSRFCGAYYRSTVYSTDGTHHDPKEFSDIKEEDEEDDDDDDDDDEKKLRDAASGNQPEDETHSEIADHLMKAAEAALKAAKKLIPLNKKGVRKERDLEDEKAEAFADIEAAKRMAGMLGDGRMEKRDIEDEPGRDLLVSYLSNVGGFDRKYRSVDDEDGNVKFEYKRMILDESGDGEFVDKPAVPDSARRRRSEAESEDDEHDGHKKMEARAAEDEPAKQPRLRLLSTSSGNSESSGMAEDEPRQDESGAEANEEDEEDDEEDFEDEDLNPEEPPAEEAKAGEDAESTETASGAEEPPQEEAQQDIKHEEVKEEPKPEEPKPEEPLPEEPKEEPKPEEPKPEEPKEEEPKPEEPKEEEPKPEEPTPKEPKEEEPKPEEPKEEVKEEEPKEEVKEPEPKVADSKSEEKQPEVKAEEEKPEPEEQKDEVKIIEVKEPEVKKAPKPEPKPAEKKAKKERKGKKTNKLHRHRRELDLQELGEDEVKTKLDHKREALESGKVEQIKNFLSKGLESFPEMILNIYKEAASFNDLTAAVAKLKEDAFKDTKIPESKKADVMKTISAQLAPLATKMVNDFDSKIREELKKEGDENSSFATQAAQAINALPDIPIEKAMADQLQSQIKKRSVDQDILDILQEHFTQNTDTKPVSKSLLSRSHRDLGLAH